MLDKRIELVKVTKDNINQLQVVIVSTLPVVYPSSFFTATIKGRNVGYLAFVEGKTVGCVVWREEECGSHLLSLGVYVLHRRRGVGSALLNLFLKECLSKEAYLFVNVENTDAIFFYQHLGFKPLHKVDNYYRHLLNNTALKMTRSIS